MEAQRPSLNSRNKAWISSGTHSSTQWLASMQWHQFSIAVMAASHGINKEAPMPSYSCVETIWRTRIRIPLQVNTQPLSQRWHLMGRFNGTCPFQGTTQVVVTRTSAWESDTMRIQTQRVSWFRAKWCNWDQVQMTSTIPSSFSLIIRAMPQRPCLSLRVNRNSTCTQLLTESSRGTMAETVTCTTLRDMQLVSRPSTDPSCQEMMTAMASMATTTPMSTSSTLIIPTTPKIACIRLKYTLQVSSLA